MEKLIDFGVLGKYSKSTILENSESNDGCFKIPEFIDKIFYSIIGDYDKVRLKKIKNLALYELIERLKLAENYKEAEMQWFKLREFIKKNKT